MESCNLPTDIIEEILLRLPVKTLLKFKCVCKQWYALIGSPSFANQHLGHERLLVRHVIEEKVVVERRRRYKLQLHIYEMYPGYEEPDRLQMPYIISSMLGPLNGGIFCLVLRASRMALLNPATRQLKPLPFCKNARPHPAFSYCVGFGLDQRGDYKVVQIQFLWQRMYADVQSDPVVTVYNSGSDSWKHLEDVDLIKSIYFVRKPLGNTFLNGAYYWLMRTTDDVAMLAFDMTNDKFQKLQVPDGIMSSTARYLKLASYDDSLALLSYDDKCVDIWVMERDGCWSKCFAICLPEALIRPLCFWNKNELLFKGEASNLVRYNVSTQKFTTVKGRGDFSQHRVFGYKESIFSLKGGADLLDFFK